MAEWARLLSECWVKPVAGSNPVLPATKKRVPHGTRFVFSHTSPLGVLFETCRQVPAKTRLISQACFCFNREGAKPAKKEQVKGKRK